MKEYGLKNWAKILFVSLSLPMSVLFLMAIITGETVIIRILGVPMLGLFLYTLINPFIHKITLGDEFITEENLLSRKQIFFADITHIGAQNYVTEIISAKAKIHLPRLLIKDSDELMSTIVSKIKENEHVLYGGDPIVLKSYFDGFYGNQVLTAHNENNLAETGFTFIEKAELTQKSWLLRAVTLTTAKGVFKITYFGKGMGYECVFVNDELVSKKNSHLWYVPRFDFTIEGMRVSVHIRFYPWFAIRKFWIEINDRVVYSE